MRIRLIHSLTLGAALALGAGCNIVGPLSQIVVGEEKTPAVHILEPGRPTVIFVDCAVGRPDRTTRGLIAQTATDLLLEEKALVNAIDPKAAITFASSADRYNKRKGIDEVGEACKAEVVVYALIKEFTLSPDGQAYAPMCRMQVRVFDVTKKERIFPLEDPGYYEIVADIKQRQGNPPASATEISNANRDLARKAGKILAWQFCEHIERPIGDPVSE